MTNDLNALHERIADLEQGLNEWRQIAIARRAEQNYLAVLLRQAVAKMNYMLQHGEWYAPEALIAQIETVLMDMQNGKRQ